MRKGLFHTALLCALIIEGVWSEHEWNSGEATVDESEPGSDGSIENNLPWPWLKGKEEVRDGRRSTNSSGSESIWDGTEKFYADDNNVAMYLSKHKRNSGEATDDESEPGSAGSIENKFPWPWLKGEEEDSDGRVILSRMRRSTNSSGSKSIWDEIEEFYSDKNNMAMYCVLPILVLVYGGCASIYCIYKCKQYVKRHKHKRLKEEDSDSIFSERNDLREDSDRPISQISEAWKDLNSDSGAWSGQTEGYTGNVASPLPWAIPDKSSAVSALGQRSERERSDMSRASYWNGRRGEAGSRYDQNSGADKWTSNLNDALEEDCMVDNGTATPVDESAIATTSFVSEKQAQQERPRRIMVEPSNGAESRAAANLSDYATNRSSTVKATDYSRFSDSKPIEIIPLSADPNLRVWDPLHNKVLGNDLSSGRTRTKIEPIGEARFAGRDTTVRAIKEDMLARYDALSTLQMAKKAAEILNTNSVEKNPFQRKQMKKKNIFIAE